MTKTTTDDPRRKMPEFGNISWDERRRYLEGMVAAWLTTLEKHMGGPCKIEMPLGKDKVAIIEIKEKNG